MSARNWLAPAILGGLLLAGMQHSGITRVADDSSAPSGVIGYAEAQLGKPYQWGGSGPSSFDCSGLATAAYASAGIAIPRTSQAEWAAGPQVSNASAGDLVFFAGADGTDAAPGHVGIVVNPARHVMIDAYGPDGAPISYDTYGLPGSRPGLQNPVGFTDPAGS